MAPVLAYTDTVPAETQQLSFTTHCVRPRAYSATLTAVDDRGRWPTFVGTRSGILPEGVGEDPGSGGRTPGPANRDLRS